MPSNVNTDGLTLTVNRLFGTARYGNCNPTGRNAMDKRRIIIDTAKTLLKAGRYHRYFRFADAPNEIWECYQAEYLPSLGERAWIVSEVRVYTVHTA